MLDLIHQHLEHRIRFRPHAFAYLPVTWHAGHLTRADISVFVYIEPALFLHTFNYVRVLEIPTPRWTSYDVTFFNIKRPNNVPAIVQDCAYTSPIWYTPQLMCEKYFG